MAPPRSERCSARSGCWAIPEGQKLLGGKHCRLSHQRAKTGIVGSQPEQLLALRTSGSRGDLLVQLVSPPALPHVQRVDAANEPPAGSVRRCITGFDPELAGRGPGSCPSVAELAGQVRIDDGPVAAPLE